MEKTTHKVLALKYRPKNFQELIGQDVMVQTITNSIKSNKLPNAYLLTGIRGTGKTTTARLIAKAINCKKDFLKEENCSCEHCEGISKSTHLDVIEMDAASKTGIDDVRELIDSSKYNPLSAQYKIFIIDEVHMLSKQAFNGLLKTLEEPPLHLKFIFATTEVRKIPATIISRCQRFDLSRVPIKVLLNHLKEISKKEKGNISDNALKLISKAAEGSVRDSLSILDRALVSQSIDKKEIDEKTVRKMLGLADRTKILQLFDFIFSGDKEKSLRLLKEMINDGIEPVNFLNDLLEIIYLIQQKKSLGNSENDFLISESEMEAVNSISKDINMSTLVIFWQFIIKSLDELTVVSNPILSIEMLVVRLIHLKDMPNFENLIEIFNKSDSPYSEKKMDNNEIKKGFFKEKKDATEISKDQIKNISQTKPELISSENKKVKMEKIDTFEDLIKISSKKKEIELKYDLERNVHLIKFSNGKIDISINENLGKDFVRNLSDKLNKWTGKRWVITLSKKIGQKTYAEQQSTIKKENLENERSSKTYKEFKNIFEDGELIEVTKRDNS